MGFDSGDMGFYDMNTGNNLKPNQAEKSKLNQGS
jgi:hypothetical protein